MSLSRAASILVPSITVSPWIRRLELHLKIEHVTEDHLDFELLRDLERKGPLAPQMSRDLGILFRPRHGTSRRTIWQKDLTELRELKIVLEIKDCVVCTNRDAFKELLERAAIDLRPEGLEVEIKWKAEKECRCVEEGGDVACLDLLAASIKGMVRLSSRDA